MSMFIRYMRADVIKLRRQSLPWIHLAIPLIGIVLFLSYYAFTPYSDASKIDGYLQAVAIALPAIIGIVCAIAAEQEYNAGGFQHLLTSPVKVIPFLSKLSLLLVFGLASILTAAVGFGVGNVFILQNEMQDISFYILAGLILFGSSIFLYVFHFIVSLRWGRGASMGLGIAGSLVSALLLTGLGDANWVYVPFAWPSRLITLWSRFAGEAASSVPAHSMLGMGIACLAAGTLLMIAISVAWVWRWEGKHALE